MSLKMFPVIKHISDVLPHIEGRDEFVVVEKDAYTYVDYRIVTEGTFPCLSEGLRAQMRRECRGLIFCSSTGKLLRRPFNKFFNLGEKPETQAHEIEKLVLESYVLEKLDGSMIAPFIVNGRLLWGTMAGETDVSELFVRECLNDNLRALAHEAIRDGYTPIFEYCSPNNQIVVRYQEPKAVLTAMRHIETGKYLEYADLAAFGGKHKVQVVRSLGMKDLDTIVRTMDHMSEEEGYVLAHPSGFRVKVKCSWYVQLHKLKELLYLEKDRIKFVITGDLDDLAQFLSEEEMKSLVSLKNQVLNGISRVAKKYHEKAMALAKETSSRKEFAEHAKQDRCPQFLFKALDFANLVKMREFVMDAVLASTTSAGKLDQYRWVWR